MDITKQAEEIIKSVKHPAIDNTLYNLGIVRDYKIEGKNVHITMAVPSPTIPIMDTLIKSLSNPIQALGADVFFDVVQMTPEELQKFFRLEQEGWKGL
jgi:ATP-binding protein involved in chromosome partitioning